VSEFSEQENEQFIDVATGMLRDQFKEAVGGFANLALAMHDAQHNGDVEDLGRLSAELSRAVFSMTMGALPSMVLHLAHEINVRTDEAATLFHPLHEEMPNFRAAVAELADIADFRALGVLARINGSLNRIQEAMDLLPYGTMVTGEGCDA
jgi:hypothetical protein